MIPQLTLIHKQTLLFTHFKTIWKLKLNIKSKVDQSTTIEAYSTIELICLAEHKGGRGHLEKKCTHMKFHKGGERESKPFNSLYSYFCIISEWCKNVKIFFTFSDCNDHFFLYKWSLPSAGSNKKFCITLDPVMHLIWNKTWSSKQLKVMKEVHLI